MDRMNFCACDSCGKDIRECESSCPKFSYNAQAVDMLLKQAEEITRLISQLESAKEALKKIGVDDYTVFYGMGTFVDAWRDKTFLMNKIAKECLKKLEE